MNLYNSTTYLFCTHFGRQFFIDHPLLLFCSVTPPQPCMYVLMFVSTVSIAHSRVLYACAIVVRPVNVLSHYTELGQCILYKRVDHPGGTCRKVHGLSGWHMQEGAWTVGVAHAGGCMDRRGGTCRRVHGPSGWHMQEGARTVGVAHAGGCMDRRGGVCRRVHGPSGWHMQEGAWTVGVAHAGGCMDRQGACHMQEAMAIGVSWYSVTALCKRCPMGVHWRRSTPSALKLQLAIAPTSAQVYWLSSASEQRCRVVCLCKHWATPTPTPTGGHALYTPAGPPPCTTGLAGMHTSIYRDSGTGKHARNRF